jgi:hypothetical protein
MLLLVPPPLSSVVSLKVTVASGVLGCAVSWIIIGVFEDRIFTAFAMLRVTVKCV